MLFKSLTAAALVVSASPAWAYIAENGLIVEGEGRDAFHVPYRGLSSAADFWCAAGDYVVRELNRAPDTRIYRTSEPPRRSGQGMRFNLSGEGATEPGLVVLSGGPGLSAAFARQLCDRFRPEDR